MKPIDSPFDVRGAQAALDELRQLEREIVELELFRRLDALERVREAVHRIGDIGSPEGILGRAADELGASSRFDRVLISQVRERTLTPHSLWVRDADAESDALLDALRSHPIPLGYPLVEADVARSQRAETVVVAASGARSPAPLRELLGWDSYIVAALTLRGSTIGLLHADAAAQRGPLEALDQEVASVYADGLTGAFERATLRQTLQRHREELRDAVQWIGGQLGGTDDVDLGTIERADAEAATEARDALTPREQEVLGLLGGGRTNAEIASSLVVSESTVKFHVKNILRKLRATSRADAVARYLRGG